MKSSNLKFKLIKKRGKSSFCPERKQILKFVFLKIFPLLQFLISALPFEYISFLIIFLFIIFCKNFNTEVHAENEIGMDTINFYLKYNKQLTAN